MFILANIVQPLIDINEAILRFWHDTIGFSWGASIIGLTIVVRLAILPLTFKQVRSMQALQRLQPEMKKIQQRYKDDKQRQQQAMMEFYKEHEVNPLASCLPLILQFPFFIGLYQTLRSSGFQDEVGNAGQFLFIKDITAPATGAVLVVLIVVYVATQLASSYVSSINIQDKNQKRLLFLFPFLFVPVVINFEAGLLIYWITTNSWTIGQQLFVRRFLPPPEPHLAGASAGGGSSSDGGGGGKAPRKASGARALAGGGGGKATVAEGGHGGKPASKKRSAAGAKASGGGKSSDGGGGNGASDGGSRKAPPPSPRKKKKRSGRRR